MAKNEIKTNTSELYDDSETNDIVEIINKQNFFIWLAANGFNEIQLKQLFYDKKLNSIEQSRFNYILRKAVKEAGCSLTEIILYLENSIIKLKKILSILDEETFYILKHELAKKYKIKIDKNNLYKLFC